MHNDVVKFVFGLLPAQPRPERTSLLIAPYEEFITETLKKYPQRDIYDCAYKQWGSVFPGAACIVALVDHFAQHCHVVDADADSWRQNHASKSTK